MFLQQRGDKFSEYAPVAQTAQVAHLLLEESKIAIFLYAREHLVIKIGEDANNRQKDKLDAQCVLTGAFQLRERIIS